CREIAFQPDRKPTGGDQLSIPGLHPGTASGRDDAGTTLKDTRKNLGFAVTEKGFAVAREYLADGHGRGGFDLSIRIGEVDPQLTGQFRPDRGLARPHHPDHHDMPLHLPSRFPRQVVTTSATE